MKVKSLRSFGHPKEMSISDAIGYEIRHVKSGRGQLEDLEERVDALTRIVSALVEHLGEDAARAVLLDVGVFHEPV